MTETSKPIRPYGVRITWDELPQPVRDWVAGELGEVSEVRPQQGGFSPGTADRVRGSRGSGFVKAVGASLNAQTPDLVAREVAVLQQLPAYAGAPVLLSSFDERIEGERWVALMVEDIAGRHPHAPWQGHEVEAALDSLARLAAEPLPETVDLPALEEDMAADVSLWPEVAADPPEVLDPWVSDNLDRLAEVSAAAVRLLRGDRLVHSDIRSDNLLVTGDGTVRVVDWPWACRGSAWVDSLMLLLNVRVHGGPDVTAYAPRLADLNASEEKVDVVLAALLGYFVHAARLPAPLGLPTVRAFQRAQGVATVDWLRERWGDSA